MLLLNKKGNKRGISEIVSYTLLIIIAIAIAALVYAFLSKYIPGAKAECPQGDISLEIRDVSCRMTTTGTDLNLTVVNKGLFNITGIGIFVGRENYKTGTNMNRGNTSFVQPLYPGENRTLIYSNSKPDNELLTYTVRILPYAIGDKGVASCDKAVVVEKLDC